MRSIFATIIAVVTATVASAGPATASTVNYQITFAAGSFPAFPTMPTPDIVLGQFEIALDTGVNALIDQTSGIHLDFLNATLDSPLSYTYSKAQDDLIVGGLAFGAGGVVAQTHDFVLAITGIAHGAPKFVNLDLADDGPGLFSAGTGTVHVSTVAPTAVAATPIPMSSLLFVSALGGLGLAAWHRRRAT